MALNNAKILDLAKGFRGRAKNCIRLARNRVEKSLQHSFRNRKRRHRVFRRLYITRVNAAAREHGVRYGQLMHGLKQEQVYLDRKILAQLAETEPYSMRALVHHVRDSQQVSVVAPANEAVPGLVRTVIVEGPAPKPSNTQLKRAQLRYYDPTKVNMFVGHDDDGQQEEDDGDDGLDFTSESVDEVIRETAPEVLGEEKKK